MSLGVQGSALRCLCRHPAGRADAGPDWCAEDRVHDRIDGVGGRSQHQGRYREESEEGNGDLERHLSCRYGRYGDGVCGAASNGPAQRYVGEERQMSASGQVALE